MDILNTILTAVLAASPGLFLALWAWFKAHAAQTDAKWDDAFVAFVTNIAKGVAADAVQAAAQTQAQAQSATAQK